MRVAAWNVGGLRAHVALVLEYVKAADIDILLLSETKCRDRAFWAFLREKTGWAVLGVSRAVTVADNGGVAPESGGVAIVCCTPGRWALTNIAADPLGFAAAEVRCRQGLVGPTAVFVAYVPPRGSPFAGDAEGLYARLAACITSSLSVYGRRAVLVGGDFNARLGSGVVAGAPHYTLDAVRVNDKELRGLCGRLSLAPTAGRWRWLPAGFTSRSLDGGTGRSTVDHVLTDSSSSNSTPLLSTMSWGALPASCSHRPVGVAFRPPPPGGTGGAGERAQRLPPPRWGSPPYAHQGWELAAAAMDAALDKRDLELGRRQHGATPPQAVAARAAATLTRALRKALDAAFPPRAPPPPPPRSEAAAARWRASAARGSRAERLPREVVAALESARAAARAARAAGDPPELLEELKRLQREAAHAVRRAHRVHRRERINELRQLRVGDPRQFFKRVAEIAPGEAGVVDDTGGGPEVPHEEGQPPPMQRLLDKLQNTLGTARPPPPALRPGGEEWFNFLPKLAADQSAGLGREISAAEVAWVLMPAQGRGPLPCPATGAAQADCALCVDFNSVRAAYGGMGDLLNVAPRNAPTINAGAASGEDLRGGHLRFMRYRCPRRTESLRRRLCEAVAGLLNASIAAGNLPEALLGALAVSLPKPGRPGGARPNHASPEFRRFIILGMILAKLGELVLASRFTHWALRCNVIDPGTQGAFLPTAHSFAHAFALVELLRARKRRGLTTFVLFTDIESAYPSVGVDVLAAQLRHLGVPARIVDFIYNWGMGRTVTLQVNGARAAPIPMVRGLGIGACNSPILWNIFFSSLGAYLQSFGAGVRMPGAGETGFHVLLFADDSVAPEDTLERLALLARRVEAWCKAWGIVIKVGPAKTAYMAVLPSGRESADYPPLTLTSGVVVPRVESYVYLGAPLTASLTLGGIAERAAQRLRGLLARYFAHSSVLKGCDAVTTRQIWKTLGVGSIGYLLSAVPLTAGALDTINKVLIAAGRRLLRLPPSAPNTMVLELAGLPSALYLVAAARAGFWLYLRNTQYRSSPAVRVFEAAAADPLPSSHGRAGNASWRAVTEAFFNYWLARGVPWPSAATRAGGALAAAGWARRVCAVDARQQCPADAGPAIVAARRLPADAPPSLAVAALRLGWGYPLGLLRNMRPSPMSYCGVGGSGAGLSLTTVDVPACGTAAMARLRLGAIALRLPPWAPAGWVVPQGAPAEEYSEAARGRECGLCGSHAPATPFHVLRECTHAPVVAARADVDSQAAEFIGALADTVARAARRFDRQGHVGEAARGVLDARAGGAPLSDFLVFHLLLVAPWHEECVEPGASLDRAVGRLFDTAVVPNQAIHSAYNLWVPWAARRATYILGTWSRAVEEQGGE